MRKDLLFTNTSTQLYWENNTQELDFDNSSLQLNFENKSNDLLYINSSLNLNWYFNYYAISHPKFKKYLDLLAGDLEGN
jgi:hypothetical protein